MFTEVKKNFQIFQDSDKTYYPEDEVQVSNIVKELYDKNSLLNPGKVYPILRKCAEEGRVHVHGGKTKFPDIPRF